MPLGATLRFWSLFRALAKLSFLKPLHLFSSIVIASLAKYSNLKLSGSFEFELDDVIIHLKGTRAPECHVTSDTSSNREHAAIVNEVETLKTVIAAGTAPCSSIAKDDAIAAFGQGFNINIWADLLCWGNTTCTPGFDFEG